MRVMDAYIIICVILVLTLAAAGGSVFITEGVERELEESAFETETESDMSISECITLCNDIFVRADDRLACHEQCHERFD